MVDADGFKDADADAVAWVAVFAAAAGNGMTAFFAEAVDAYESAGLTLIAAASSSDSLTIEPRSLLCPLALVEMCWQVTACLNTNPLPPLHPPTPPPTPPPLPPTQLQTPPPPPTPLPLPPLPRCSPLCRVQ